MDKRATTSVPINSLIERRYSPRAFAERPLADEDLVALFEAARWAPSCYNDQPWRFLVVTREDDNFSAAVDCLMAGNASWAKDAAAVAVAIHCDTFTHNGADNPYALYDLGLAVAQLSVEATARHIGVHQMAGYFPDKARAFFGIPEGFSPGVMLVLGYFGDPESLNEELKARELAPRERRSLDSLFHRGTWPSHW